MTPKTPEHSDIHLGTYSIMSLIKSQGQISQRQPSAMAWGLGGFKASNRLLKSKISSGFQHLPDHITLVGYT